jgi:matrix metalloproteinase-14 (membrane-inserted)
MRSLLLPGGSRQKRYALQGSRWKTKTLTYKISKYSSKKWLSKADVDLAIKRALNVWSVETNLEFVKKASGRVHLDIRFEKRYHGDKDSFYGNGGILAHAFFPRYGGDVHFDDDEDWTVNSFRGTSLLMSASHELGHSLGLAHSRVKGALMSPFYSGYRSDLSLHSDDVDGIQALYGKKETFQNRNLEKYINIRSYLQPKTPPPPPSTPTSFICQGNIDTVVTTSKGVTYAFLGGEYWKLSDTSVEAGYPRLISHGWPGLPGNLDAAFTWTNGKTYFFKGSKYWRFTDAGQMDDGYPKKVSKVFEGIPDSVDAAFVWPVNNKIYFFKESQYWKFDPHKSPPVSNS